MQAELSTQIRQVAKKTLVQKVSELNRSMKSTLSNEVLQSSFEKWKRN